MGCCVSVDGTGDHGARMRNDEIDDHLRMEKLNMQNQVKLLLLGAGESGKSTLLKQMKLIHEGGFSLDERMAYREIIYSNTIQSMHVILDAMDGLGLAFSNEASHKAADHVIQQPAEMIDEAPMPADLVSAIQALWVDQGVQEAVRRRNEFQLNDSASYYFESMDRIGKPDYVPSDQDVLRSRVKSTGITETHFRLGDLTYRMFDVGGQRSERKKWIHCFENVTSVIFMVAISEYDQVLIEDESVNRMDEALTLFDSICNSRWFEKTSIILFLNKTDLFKEKLQHSKFSNYFPDYRHNDTDYDTTSKYIMERFKSLSNHTAEKQIYTHFTCATDTEQIRFVMTAVNDIILQANLRNVGLL
ncbi:guanine nucleotide binding protein, alpha subunit [Zychaea mexicana]|uniref:guanine nucleotide binding protein, alpha subunit n=1 Tax=Zychaea mexicana TaxID=64656 RepID=UPI0022FF0E49|nr:guanine nucleotide binding protein, alpha subunit [Zychaea mexicana]KAI9477133.1 guanine nucleotide binding protein, alpha subunit [Zychaea mexicana]